MKKIVSWAILAILIAMFFLGWHLVGLGGLKSFINGIFDNCATHKTVEQCDNDKACEGIFGPSACGPVDSKTGGQLCTADISFQGCQKVSEGTLIRREAVKREKIECEKLGAKYDEYSSMPCYCPSLFKYVFNEKNYFEYLKDGGPKKFIQGKGCQTAKEVCEARGGKWQSDYEPIKVVEAIQRAVLGRPKVPKEQCDNDDMFCLSYGDYKQGDDVKFKCYLRWAEDTQRCNVAVYNKGEITQPCKIGDEYFTGENLLR